MKKAGSRRNSQKMISAAFSLLLAVHILLARVVVFPDHSSTPHVCGRVQLVSGETVPIIYGVDYTGTKFTENVSVMQNPSNKDCSIYLCGPSVTSNVVEQSDIKEVIYGSVMPKMQRVIYLCVIAYFRVNGSVLIYVNLERTFYTLKRLYFVN